MEKIMDFSVFAQYINNKFIKILSCVPDLFKSILYLLNQNYLRIWRMPHQHLSH